MDTSRRQFFATMALGVSASAFPNMVNSFDQMESISDANNALDFDNQELDSWFDGIKGDHRIVYDGSQPHNTLPIVWNWAFLESNNSTGIKDDNITAMTVLRHSGIVFAFNSEAWNKFNLGALVDFKDNKTGEHALRNTVFEPQEGDMPLPPIQGIKDLQARGSMFCVCDLATKVYSSAVAANMGLNADDVYKEMVASILPGIKLVPSGVWALGRAQNRGCGYIFAG